MTTTQDTEKVGDGTGWGSWAAAAAMVATAVAMLLVARRGTNIDFEHMYRPVKALLDGDWQGVYPANTSGTSPTGWVLLTALPMLVFGLFVDSAEAFTLTNLLVLPATLFAFRFALRALWPLLSPAAAWGLATVAVWLPTTLAAYLNAYHPQDLAAVALVVTGLALVAQRRWWWAGAVFGLAVMTRQWALLAFLPAVGFTGRDIWKVAAAAGAVVAALTAPVLLVGGNEGWVTAFSAKSAAPVGDTILGRFRYNATAPQQGGNPDQDVVFLLARFAPLLAAFALGAVAWLRRLTRPEALVAFVIAGLSLRMLFETANYLYYWVPFAALFVLLVPYKKAAWVAVAVFALGPWALDFVYPPIGTTGGGVVAISDAERLIRAVATFLLSVGALVACYLLVDAPAESAELDEPAVTPPAEVAGGRPRWPVAVGVVALAAVFVPFLAGAAPSPVSRLREITTQQQQSRDMLRDQGVDVGDGQVGRLEE